MKLYLRGHDQRYAVEQMMASLARLGRLEGDYLVYPGHDSHSTLDEERRYNPCLRQAMGNG